MLGLLIVRLEGSATSVVRFFFRTTR